jgi:outer membrane protein assembly factor BamB
MKAAFSSTRTGKSLLIGALALALAGCEPPETILMGEREDIRPDTVAPQDQVNESRAIRLPGQTANAAWPQSHGSAVYRTAHPALRAAPQRIWSVGIGEGDSRRQRITAMPVVGGGLIYALDSAARVTAVSPSGQTIWTTDLVPAADESGEATGGGLAFDGGTVYVSSGFGVLTALDSKTGATRWRQELDATGSGMPTVRDGLVYLVAGDDTGWAVRSSDGRVVWQVQGAPSVSNILGAPAPTVTSDLVIFAFGSGDMVATFRKGGLRRWNASVAGQRVGRSTSRISDVTGSPVSVGDTIYAANHSGRTVALDANTGDRLWTADEGATGPVWPVGGSLFSVSDVGQLLRIDATDGAVIWRVDLPGFVKDKPRKRGEIFAHYGPLIAGGQVIVASNDGFLRFFNPQDGSLTRSVDVPDGATTAPVVAGNTLYVVSRKGELHAFR